MKKANLLTAMIIPFMMACSSRGSQQKTSELETEAKEPAVEDEFKYQTEQFADLKIIRYQIPDFGKLSLKQKKLVYYLTQAGISGRDIHWDQNYRHNLTIRRALENIVKNYKKEKTGKEWDSFMIYVKRVWFSSGIHHHYSSNKIMPEFSKEYFKTLLDETKTNIAAEIINIIFDPSIDAKKVNLDPEKGLLKGSSVNFYAPGITEQEVDEFYKKLSKDRGNKPISYGINSKLVKENGKLKEQVWKVDGMYGSAIKEIIGWLEKAVEVAENQPQADALKLLIEYYKTGDLKTWDAYNVAWSKATDGDIDYINSFIEVYNDPKGYRGSYESIVQIKDFEASARMKTLADNVQWFEDNSTIMNEHKKEKVVGVTFKVVTVAGEAGDASPSTPIGVNLPNSDWIRAEHGSKSVSLGNIVYAYGKAGGDALLEEFAGNEEEVRRAKEHGKIADNMLTAMHEVIGHASGKLNTGIGTPKETLKNYANTLEEGRADLVALYFMMDTKLVELGLIPSLEVGKAGYDNYIRNGLMLQLRRLSPGDIIEESHMRNRQLVAAWVYEKGQKDNVIEKVSKNGKTYFYIKDYNKLRVLFGNLLKEIQRIKSEGDYEAGRALVENYGVKVNQEIHKEVLARSEVLNIAPYGGFINPYLIAAEENGEIKDIKVEYPDDFTQQMLYYAEKYSFLPDYN